LWNLANGLVGAAALPPSADQRHVIAYFLLTYAGKNAVTHG